MRLLETRRERYIRKLHELKRRLIKDILYFTFSGLIFYGLMVTTVIPFTQGVATAIKTNTVNITKSIIPATNAEEIRITSPIPQDSFIKTPLLTATPTPTPERTPEYQDIEKEIRRVFGTHADKAMLLLGGRPEVCSENAKLNPLAVNHNNDSYGSIDYGVFQINNHWQGVSKEAFLFDYRINIAMAYRIYVDSGYSFNLWTCGRRLGI